MQITFHGAAQTVTGSQHLLEVNGRRVLLECGLYQGKRAEAEARNKGFLHDPTQVDAVLLSHAHIDHSGNLPNLFKNGYRGDVFCTSATAHLANIMLLDSAHIQEMDAQSINWKNDKKGKNIPHVQPLYTLADASMVAQHFKPQEYHQAFEVVEGVRATFYDAGHILGSAGILLEIDEIGGPSRLGRKKPLRLWFSGDIGRRGLPLIRDPELPQPVDVLMMECTYGDKHHNNPQQAYVELRDVVTRTLRRGGKVVIPAFAVGRTQDLVYNLNKLIEDGEVPRVPVYVDSPLAVNASDIFKQHPECFDEATNEFINSGPGRKALAFDSLTYTRSADESKALNERKDPMIIISAAGMAENGRIRHHLKYNIENPKNTILIVSWQAPETLGRRIADREKRVHILGDVYDVKAEVATIGGLSAHAGQNMLCEYACAAASGDPATKIFLVHGEAKSAEPFMQRLAEAGLTNVHYPELHSTVDI